jgi:hypothetical protein
MAKKKSADKPAEVGHPGGIAFHVSELVTALRAGDYASAFTFALELFQMAKEDWSNWPRLPVGALGDVSAAATADPCALADALEEQATLHGGSKAPKGAFPWAALLPLLLQALQMTLQKKGE